MALLSYCQHALLLLTLSCLLASEAAPDADLPEILKQLMFYGKGNEGAYSDEGLAGGPVGLLAKLTSQLDKQRAKKELRNIAYFPSLLL